MKLPLAFAMALAIPTASFAVGSNDTAPPKETKTTTECTDGKVYDDKTAACVDAKDSRLDDDRLYDAVREFAYAGQYDFARQTLAAMSSQTDDRVLTYRGFIARKEGQTDTAMRYYQAALRQNPDNILTRSYMGQGLAAAGDTAAARVQLAEIRARGGQGTWAELALLSAIENGTTYSY